ncbi:hypothetical protein RHGRI_032041 [Rhododendron griersonianum]|uniref:Uncharacterized protein n=1 Tax=Rhododendron griersonianum TaxID=479676 RepID=A0AAV6IFZ8_9ERIC|nr:hypothetical protein RHGRI_032041 [Rhododendron griersonianum]
MVAAAGKPSVVVVIVLVIATISNSVSADPDMLQDVCVADLNNGIYFVYRALMLQTHLNLTHNSGHNYVLAHGFLNISNGFGHSCFLNCVLNVNS